MFWYWRIAADAFSGVCQSFDPLQPLRVPKRGCRYKEATAWIIDDYISRLIILGCCQVFHIVALTAGRSVERKYDENFVIDATIHEGLIA